MNIKTFAQIARTNLMEGVAKKLIYWGFNTKGEVLEEPIPVSGGYAFRGDTFDDPNVPQLWSSLKNAIAKKGINSVVEEAAYTWFNRLMAIRILSKNGYDLPQLEFVEGLNQTPIILQRARQGHYDFLNELEKTRLQKIIGDYNKENEAFALLLIGYCHSHNTLNKVFGKVDDYTELLLPDNMLQEQGFLHLLNTTDAISDEDYKEVELIGWLYQFYISERKDEVFASFKKKKKAEAKDIPAATQIFTPNWIVKYMVENTAGKLWLDHKPNSPLKDQMKYLVDSEEGLVISDETHHSPLITNVEDLTLIDPACGSGHILVEGFELLYQMYLEEYYTPEEAVQTIFEKNLYGLDIDDRAAQLANFAVLLKAAKVYPDVWDKNWQLNIYAMPEASSFSRQDVADFLGEAGKDHIEALEKALKLMQQAKNLGSVMQLDLSDDAIAYIQQRYQELQQAEHLDFHLTALLPKLQAYIPVLVTLAQKFTAVVANPPYMGQKNMNGQLKNYVNKTYPLSKSDLFAVFMERMMDMVQDDARIGCITMESWMFLSSYEKLRNNFIEKYSIVGLGHFGWHILGIAFGTAMLILEKSKKVKIGEYSYLTIDDIDRDKNIPYVFPKKDNGRFARIPQSNFEKIPGSPIAYWATDINIYQLENYEKLGEVEHCKKGADTGNNDKFLRFWFEINKSKIDYPNKWVFYNKGGSFRRWYGNYEYCVNWENDGEELHNSSANLRSKNLYFRPSLTWNALSSADFSIRYSDKLTIFDSAGSSLFLKNSKTSFEYYLGLLNSKVIQKYLLILNPTFNYGAGTVGKLPLSIDFEEQITNLSRLCIFTSKKDWDSRETSWDFKQSPLLGIRDQGLVMSDENAPLSTNHSPLTTSHSPLTTNHSSLSKAYERWEKDVTQDFFQLHLNEEALNRIFIDIYGLQEELTPEVALKDITILQEELDRKQLAQDEAVLREKGVLGYSDKGLGNRDETNHSSPITPHSSLIPENYSLPIDKSEVMQQFISYAIGVFMGRYRLDKPGLHIAHPNPSSEELNEYVVISGKGLGPKIQEQLLKYLRNKHPEFSRSIGLAKSNASGNASLSNKQSISESGNVWANKSNSQSGNIHSKQYSGGAAEGNQGVSAFSEDSQRLTGRAGDTVGDSQSSRVFGQQNPENNPGTNNGNQQNAEWIKTEAKQLITQHSALSTHPSPLTTITIDEDAIIPLMGTASKFKDDALYLVQNFLDIIWGHETRTENLNFLQSCLDKDLERYLVKDFWKYHCKTYKKKPIYWLFSSKKGAFQVLVYMHRMNAFTVEKIRSNYLLEHLKFLNAEISNLESNKANLNTQQSRKLDQLRKDLLECEEYDMHLKNAADAQIVFDLDDGVTENYKLFKDVVAKIR